MISDKHFWHGYVSEYERIAFSQIKDPKNILEFGVGGGASIAWLVERFLTAHIVGADIDLWRTPWPLNSRISYERVDQDKRTQVRDMFISLNRSFELIIEDGSHKPAHQATCLIESLPWLCSGGYYILEDCHTSYPAYSHEVNAFHVLLAIQHLKNVHLDLTDWTVEALSKNSFFTGDEIRSLYRDLVLIHLYRRTQLPLWCFFCSSKSYDYVNLKCNCGQSVYVDPDSMAFILQKN